MVSKIEKWMSIIDKEEARKLVPLQRLSARTQIVAKPVSGERKFQMTSGKK